MGMDAPWLESAKEMRIQSTSVRRALILPATIVFAISLAITPTLGAQRTSSSYREEVLAIQQQIQSNHLDAARTLLASAARRYPADGGLENLLGVLEVQQGNVDAAKTAFTEAIVHSPRLESAYLNLGRIYMQTAESNPGDRHEALRVYEKLLNVDPANAEASYQEAILLMWNGNYQSSLAVLGKLDAKAKRQVGVEALDCADDFALGRATAGERAAAQMAGNPEITEQDAMMVLPALRAAHRADLLDILFTAAAKRAPLSASGLRILGLAQEAEGKLALARATLEQVFSMDPQNPAPLVDLTRVALAGKDYRGALGYLAHARVLEPNNSAFAYEFAVICLKLDLLSAASKAMGEAVKISPDNPDYNLGMGKICSFEEDPGHALPYLMKYHDLRPADAEGILALGNAYFQEGDYKNSFVWMSKAAGIPGTAARAHYYLGAILREQGKYDQAIAELERSAALKPDEPKPYAELGRVYMQMKNYPEAKKQLDRALGLDPDNYEANLALLRFYSYTGDPRREEQSKRFAEIKKNREKDYLESMRQIEIRPGAEQAN
jgi:cytochrome c-type biogenesis protein CcmH/NrfG